MTFSSSDLPGSLDELEFWSSFIKSERFKSNWCKTAPNPELDSSVLLALSMYSELKNTKTRILDVGSGPVSILSRLDSHFDQDIELFAADPLADEYRNLLHSDALNNDDVVVPIKVAAEELSKVFKSNTFDIVHTRNALDHCVNPVEAIKEMNKVLVNNGFLIVHGFENEGSWENWNGMHKWNLALSDNDLIISNKDRKISSTSEIFQTTAKLIFSNKIKLNNTKTWITLIFRKIIS